MTEMKLDQSIKNEQGVTLIEVAISSFIFLVFLLAIFDATIVGYKFLTVKFVANRAIRVVNLGQPLGLPAQPGEAISNNEIYCQSRRRTWIESEVNKEADKFGLDQLSSNDIRVYNSVGVNNLGKPRELVKLYLNIPIKIRTFELFNINTDFNIHSRAIGVNEPFDFDPTC